MNTADGEHSFKVCSSCAKILQEIEMTFNEMHEGEI